MRVFLALLTAALLAVLPTLAQAGGAGAPGAAKPAQAGGAGAPGAAKEVQGAVKSVDPAKKMVTLEDGTALMVSDDAKLKELKPGTKIKASYDEKGGQKVTTSIEVMK